ncbi:Uncharacterised protein [Candidatus Anstonella stagnisolia]|nr:Uncharacterised protein [Candidatus Anstonella stagnisolia]
MTDEKDEIDANKKGQQPTFRIVQKVWMQGDAHPTLKQVGAAWRKSGAKGEFYSLEIGSPPHQLRLLMFPLMPVKKEG